MSRAALLLAALAAAVPGTLPAQVIALTGGTVYPVSGPPIERATVVIRDGRIEAVGAGIAIPAGATRVDVTGRLITPGLIHASTTLGLAQVGSVDATNESSREGDIDASFNVAEGLNPDVVNLAIARTQGITGAISRPTGGLVAGQAVFIRLDASTAAGLVSQAPAAMVVNLNEGSRSAGGGSRAGALQRLRRVFRDALEYERRQADYRRRQMQDLSAAEAELEALLPVLKGTIPLYVLAHRRSDIDNALALAREFSLRLIILGGAEAWKSAPALAAARVPVAVTPLENIPSFDGPGARSDNATLLAAAGVTVIIIEGETGGPRNLRFAAGHAVRNGLSREQALRAITLAPAQAFGLADRFGSIEAGKVADLVVWSGDPFEFSTRPERVIIGGVTIPMTSRMTELLDRYRTLPPRY